VGASLTQASPLSLSPAMSQPPVSSGINQGQIDCWFANIPPDYGITTLANRVEAIRTTQGNGLSPAHAWTQAVPPDGGAYPPSRAIPSQPAATSGLNPSHTWFTPNTRDTGSLAVLGGLSPLGCQAQPVSGVSASHQWASRIPLDGGAYPPATPLLSQPRPSSGLSPGHGWTWYVPTDPGRVYFPLRDATSLVIEVGQIFPDAEHSRAQLI